MQINPHTNPNLDQNLNLRLSLLADKAEADIRESTRLSPRTILFAEDNDDLREITDHFLSTMGFRVVSCSDGDLAAAAFCTHATIDMLLTDLDMPGRSGMELARELTALRPSLPVVIVSGSVLSDEASREIKLRNWTFMSKPCRLTVLLESLVTAFKTPQEMTA